MAMKNGKDGKGIVYFHPQMIIAILVISPKSNYHLPESSLELPDSRWKMAGNLETCRKYGKQVPNLHRPTLPEHTDGEIEGGERDRCRSVQFGKLGFRMSWERV